MFCATPSAIDEYFDKKAIEGGNITRTILCRLDETLGEDGALYTPYSPEQRERIEHMLQRLMDDTYDKNGGLMPVIELDTAWLDKTVCQWVRQKGKEASLNGNRSLDVFRKRSSVSAFRVAALCQYLYELEKGGRINATCTDAIIQKRVRQIYLFMADYILGNMMDRWGKRFDELNTKREQENKPGPKAVLFDQLSETFSRSQLRSLIEQQGKTTPDKVFLSQWKKLRVIEEVEENVYRKLKV